jgi:hypothetical protein
VKTALKVVGIIVALVLIIWGGFALKVALSGPKGVGDAIIKKNSAENWTAAQGRFEKLYAGIQSADQKTELAAARLATNPTDLTLQQTHAGVQSGCITLVADYNAESRKFLSEEFKSTDLPYQINTTSPKFDCK